MTGELTLCARGICEVPSMTDRSINNEVVRRCSELLKIMMRDDEETQIKDRVTFEDCPYATIVADTEAGLAEIWDEEF